MKIESFIFGVIIVLILIVGVVFIVPRDENEDSLTLVCNGSDCEWFPTTVTDRLENCELVYSHSRGEYYECPPFE